jgi:SAM-dependent methyltransferase
MPTVEENLEMWSSYDWDEGGEEWSVTWGSSDVMWSGALWPRLRTFLPASTVVEIGPGHGRIAFFLRNLCTDYVGIDLSPDCVTACRERFSGFPHMRFGSTTGLSLPGVEDASVEFAISYDSLVHVDAMVLEGYVGELARVLRPGGAAFIHHSNLGAYLDGITGELTVENTCWRDPEMTAGRMRDLCSRTSLQCRVQELINWQLHPRWIVEELSGGKLTDCFSLLLQGPFDSEPETRVEENPHFMVDALRLAEISRLYEPGQAINTMKAGETNP